MWKLNIEHKISLKMNNKQTHQLSEMLPNDNASSPVISFHLNVLESITRLNYKPTVHSRYSPEPKYF